MGNGKVELDTTPSSDCVVSDSETRVLHGQLLAEHDHLQLLQDVTRE